VADDGSDVSLDDLFENAPCGYVATDARGQIVRANQRFAQLTGLTRGELEDQRRLQNLLSPGGRIYYETHLVPLLRLRGSVDEIALELVRRDGSRLPVLVNASTLAGRNGRLSAIRFTIFAAQDRRRATSRSYSTRSATSRRSLWSCNRACWPARFRRARVSNSRSPIKHRKQVWTSVETGMTHSGATTTSASSHWSSVTSSVVACTQRPRWASYAALRGLWPEPGSVLRGFLLSWSGSSVDTGSVR
jgi:PAS domain S-box-containing protein